MRNIGTISCEKDAVRLTSYLKHKGILNTCEVSFEVPNGSMSYQIWVHDEDRLKEAHDLFENFCKTPSSPQFDVPITEQIPEEEQASLEIEPEVPLLARRLQAHLTHFVIALCAFFFVVNSYQKIPLAVEGVAEEFFSLTPIQAECFYDLPPFFEKLTDLIQKHRVAPNQKVEQLSPEIQEEFDALPHVAYWRGFYDWIILKIKTSNAVEAEGPLFIKLRQGEVWRLFSPCLLHAGFLHILFNMIWVWILCRPIEQKIGVFRTLFLTLVVGIGSNTMQYLMGGPFFIGYSGVVMGLAGFIWSRGKIAPWEGYAIQKSTLLFLALFVLAMFGLQFTSFILHLFSDVNFSPNIANAAHIAGAFLGALLGRLSFFSWRVSR
jgi:GlpG protein